MLLGPEISSDRKLLRDVFNEKEIDQNQYVTENYVYTEIGDKKMMYLPEKNKQYLIDTERDELKELDFSAQMAQINQLKAMIGQVNTWTKQ